MRFRDLFTLRKPADVAAEAQAAEDRTIAPLDALVIEAREVLAHYRETLPHAFDARRDRRIGDKPMQGFEVVGCGNPRLPPFDIAHKGGHNRGGAL